jgi:hypothetical protein
VPCFAFVAENQTWRLWPVTESKDLADTQVSGRAAAAGNPEKPPLLWGAPADDGPHPAVVQEQAREQLGRLRDSLAPPPPGVAGEGPPGPPPAPTTASQHAPEYRPHWFDPLPERPSPAARAQDQEERQQHWVRIEGGGGPPLTAAVWLLGDPGEWRPQQAHAGLWRSLRTAMLSAVWGLRTRRLATGSQFGPTDVGRDFTAAVRRLVRADWLRATTDITDMQGMRQSCFFIDSRLHGGSEVPSTCVQPRC